VEKGQKLAREGGLAGTVGPGNEDRLWWHERQDRTPRQVSRQGVDREWRNRVVGSGRLRELAGEFSQYAMDGDRGARGGEHLWDCEDAPDSLVTVEAILPDQCTGKSKVKCVEEVTPSPTLASPNTAKPKETGQNQNAEYRSVHHNR